jgi:EpsI family protein
MNAIRIRALLILVLAIVAAAVAHAWRPTRFLADQRPKIVLEELFPKAFEGWRIDDNIPVQLVSPDQQAMLNKIYNQTLNRTYINDAGYRIMLSVAYGGDQSDGTRAHRPEVCYPAQGFQIMSNSTTTLNAGPSTLPARRLVAQQGGRIEPITYWVLVGETVALSGAEQKMAQLNYSTRGLIPDGMLVRVSSIDGNVKDAYAMQEKFIYQLLTAIPMVLRDRVVGSLKS